MRVLVYGSKGLIGSLACGLFRSTFQVVEGKSRIENQQDVHDELRAVSPMYVFCATGRTYYNGSSTIDGLEGRENLTVNLRDNLVGPMVLAKECHDFNVHLTIITTGCIYNSIYEGEFAVTQFTEQDPPNFFDSSYSIVKGHLNTLLQLYPNVLALRIRLPILPMPHPRNSLTKLLNYPKICSLENSITTSDLFERYLVKLMQAKVTGLLNFTNDGGIRHVDIMEMYREIVDPEHKYELVSREELLTTLKAGRSNCVLDASRLRDFFPDLPSAHKSMRECILKYKAAVHSGF